MNPWLEAFDKFGWPAVIFVALGIFFWKALWPAIIRHMEMMMGDLKSDLRAERDNSRIERKEFLITLEQYRQSGERNREAIEKLAIEVGRIADKLCNLPH